MRRGIFLFGIASLAALGWASSLAVSQSKKDVPTNAPPGVVVTLPLAVDAGKPTRIVVRGVRVDTVTEVRLSEPKSAGKVVGNAKKIPVGNQQNAAQVGDSEIEIEVTIPGEVPSAEVPFTLVGPGGESKPHRLIVNDSTPRLAEKEPNDGFRQSQPVNVPGIIDGSIHQPQDVDVFRMEGKAGERLVCEVQAARFGSPLDAILTLYDADGRIVATADDSGGSRDPVLRITLPRNGTYYLAILDAQDQGGPLWIYRVVICKEP